jgi:hypothetical protein
MSSLEQELVNPDCEDGRCEAETAYDEVDKAKRGCGI